jgi:acetoin utilization deacetylase AcuC-like enzyme
VVNAAAPPHAPRELWRRLFEQRIVSAMAAFAPDLVLISAGFDAHRRDPLAHQSLEAEDFAWATRAVLAASTAAKGRVVSSLEGGYDLEALGRSAAAHVEALARG